MRRASTRRRTRTRWASASAERHSLEASPRQHKARARDGVFRSRRNPRQLPRYAATAARTGRYGDSAMRIGVPKETKTLEGRVALVPAAAGDLVKRGHEVWIE